MKKCVITIGRQCGSGGHTIGKTVAERLGIPFYDKRAVRRDGTAGGGILLRQQPVHQRFIAGLLGL